jgi:(E)-4-hydroxy-3-methylbut-2-enyl-diphosphate synthase
MSSAGVIDLVRVSGRRHITQKVRVGEVSIGGGEPVVVQSMTNTDTADIDVTVAQIKDLVAVGSEIVRITVNNNKAAQAVPYIKDKLLAVGLRVPLVGCFHYNGHQLLSDYPECAKALDKYRINPGNVGFADNRDKRFEQIINIAIAYDKPVRIGGNWGSLDQDLMAKLLDDNQRSANPEPLDKLTKRALVKSVLDSAALAVRIGLPKDRIILSAKVSRVSDLIDVYRELAHNSNYALHLGLTEAGGGVGGIVSTSAALALLLREGIGDTIRASITPSVGESRTKEVQVCREVLQSLGIRYFVPRITACPGCGRTNSTFFQELAAQTEQYVQQKMADWRVRFPGVEKLQVAVMGCIVNGPGESKHADIGISLPGSGEMLVAPVFIEGRKFAVLKGDNIVEEFQTILSNYVEQRFATKGNV